MVALQTNGVCGQGIWVRFPYSLAGSSPAAIQIVERISMIQKRYQYWSRDGIVWTSWINYCEDDSQLEELKETYKWQLKNKLKNEFRLIT